MSWAKAINDWQNYLTAAGRPETTRYLRSYQLRRFAADQLRGPWTITTDGMVDWIVGHGWKPETMRSYRSALTSFYKWAHAAGRIDHNPAALLPPVKLGTHQPRPTPEQRFRDAVASAEPRVKVMILLAARLGMRRGEICRVHSNDLLEDLEGWSLRVHGKGDKERIVPLSDDMAALLRSHEPGWVFPGNDHGHLSPAHAGKLVSRALGDGWTTHTLRHRFASVSYAGSRDLLAVQTLLGHSSPSTTRRYIQQPQDALRAAMAWAT